MKVRKTVIVALFTVLALLTTGAEGCSEAQKNSPAGHNPVDNPDRVPAPQPDHRPDPVTGKTPGPVAGDPNPHRDDKHWIIFVSWSPKNESVTIDWEVGRTSRMAREYSGGKLSPPPAGVGKKGDRYSVDAEWAPESYKRLNGTAAIWIQVVVNGDIQCSVETVPRPASQKAVSGTACVGFIK